MKFNFSKTHGIEYTPSAMFKFDLNVTSFKLSSASWWPKGHHSASAGIIGPAQPNFCASIIPLCNENEIFVHSIAAALWIDGAA